MVTATVDNPLTLQESFPAGGLVSFGVPAFYPFMFSNGTYKDGGVADLRTIAPILGAELQSDGTWEYVPERIPANFYRTAQPFTLDVLLSAALKIISYNPTALPDFPWNLFPDSSPSNPPSPTDPSNIRALACFTYNQFMSIDPAIVNSVTQTVFDVVSYVVDKLGPYFANFSCDEGATTVPGSFAPPPGRVQIVPSNNVYNKVYFPSY